jgi:hypothetical protein
MESCVTCRLFSNIAISQKARIAYSLVFLPVYVEFFKLHRVQFFIHLESRTFCEMFKKNEVNNTTQSLK